MNRDAQSLLLVLLGAAIGRIALDGSFANYVRAGLRPWLIAAAAVLLLIGLAGLAREHLPRLRRSAAAPHPGAATEHGNERTSVAWLLVLPVLAIFVVAPGALGAYSANRGGGGVGSAPPNANGFAPLPAGNPVSDTVRDFSERALWDAGRTLHGRTVTLTGFVTPRDSRSIYLTRMFITCCAADASPMKVTVTGPVAGRAANSWLSVTGTFTGVDRSRADDGADPVPQLQASSVHAMKPPSNPYEN